MYLIAIKQKKILVLFSKTYKCGDKYILTSINNYFLSLDK